MIHITDDNVIQNKNTAIALGNFDGLHIGHQKLINKMKKYANLRNIDIIEQDKLVSSVFSFYPHPQKIFSKSEFYTILTSEEKEYLLTEMGIDIFIEYPFSKEFSQIDPEWFITKMLFEKLKCRALFVGEGFKFGKSRSGDCQLLSSIGNKIGMDVVIIENVTTKNLDSEIKISSSVIRNAIVEKKFDFAERLLSRPYFLMGNVGHGKKIGRTLGFPTVNLIIPKDKLLPQNGVYLTRTYVKNKKHWGITNIGTNPTVDLGSNTRTIETYLFDFDGNAYGDNIRVEFYSWIRDEIKFKNVEQLKAQIDSDIIETKRTIEKICLK